jgi:predicted nucleotidyltransferase
VRRVNDVLGELATTGIVTRDSAPPAYLYRLNREHVAAEGIIALANMWAALLERMRTAIDDWGVQPVAVWLFGSAARGEAGVDSDLDVLLVPPVDLKERRDQQELWQAQTQAFAARVQAWSGNGCELLELDGTELAAAVERDERLVRDLRDHAVVLTGPPPRRLLRTKAGA